MDGFERAMSIVFGILLIAFAIGKILFIITGDGGIGFGGGLAAFTFLSGTFMLYAGIKGS